MTDPFCIEPGTRTAISVSGGRTSGYMLWRVLQANGGRLSPDTVAMFANTGREDEATLRFVRAMTTHWGVPIVWLEFLADEPRFAVVDFDTANRDGAPFAALIRKRQFLPSPVQRFCTSELKIRTMHRYLRAATDWYDDDEGWDQMVGIRADEQRRVAKIRARPSPEIARETMMMPLADAGVTVQEVNAFWLAQPFTLELPTINGRTLAGNCDLCFLKPPAQRLSLIREKPERAVWWMEQEAYAGSVAHGRGGRFTKDGHSYAALSAFAREQRDMFDPEQEALACFCGD